MACLVASGEYERRVEDLLGSVIRARGLSLVRVRCHDASVQVMIERENQSPVTAGDCELLAKAAFLVLRTEGCLNGRGLEVSSPGVDRPLTRLDDFSRFALSHVCLKVEGQPGTLRGRLLGCQDGVVLVEAESGSLVRMPFCDVKEAHLDGGRR